MWLIQIVFYICIGKILCNEKCVRIFHRAKPPQIDNDSKCVENDVCKKVFNISYIIMPPYSPTELWEIVRICCGPCTKHQILHNFLNITSVTMESIRSSHFVYPFIAGSNQVYLYGRYFIPAISAPKTYYITVKSQSPMFKTIFDLYPLIVVCILMAIISGFVAWILETWSNREEFPRPFLRGWCEGFWWSFVTMTTVGYGDKTPKTLPARFFSIFWVFTGMIAIGILTASLTKAILEIDAPDIPDIRGDKVFLFAHFFFMY